MKPADLAALPFRVGAAARGARLFHPRGVLATGTLVRRTDDDVGLPLATGDVLARISKGVGAPGALPDVLGLAFRMEPREGDQLPWDVLLASALGGTGWSKLVPFPARSLNTAVLTTLQPLVHESGNWWLRARVRPPEPEPKSGMSLDRYADRINRDGLVFDIEQARFRSRFTPLAQLTLTATVDPAAHPDIGFDPTVNTTRGVRLGPGWLRRLREVAYRQSREGRRGQGD